MDEARNEPPARAPGSSEAVLRPVGGVEEVQAIGALGDEIVRLLGLETDARSVWLHPNTAHHIYTLRGIDRGDADFVFSYMPAAVLRPQYCGRDPRSNGRFDLVYFPDDAARGVFVALKLVSAGVAGSGQDEIWVSTAHPLPRNFMSRKRYRDSLFQTGLP